MLSKWLGAEFRSVNCVEQEMAGKMNMASGREELLLSSTGRVGSSQAGSVLLATPVVSKPSADNLVLLPISVQTRLAP